MNRNLIASILCLGLCGCGTLHNVAPYGAGETRVYGGVRGDLRQAKDSIQGAAQAKSLGDFAGNTGVGLLSVLDVPLSAVGDTVTLPVTVKRAVERQ